MKENSVIGVFVLWLRFIIIGRTYQYYLEIEGLLELRQLIIDFKQKNVTVLMVSHDVDLINDVSTDIIHFDSNKTLQYYPGTYRDFVGYRSQRTLHHLRKNAALKNKRNSAIKTIITL